MNVIGKLISLWFDWKSFNQTMRDWLGGDGKPVPPKVSQRRADMCLDCAFNAKGFAVEAIGDAVRHHLSAKRKMSLSVSGEELLHTCSLCRCALPLKVHVPIKHIRAYQREEVRQKIRERKPECWQLFG